MDILDAQTVADAFPQDGAGGAIAQLGPIFDSNGGYYNVTGNPVYAQYAYGRYGEYYWSDPVPIPVGPAILEPGTVGVRFRNYTAGAVATVSGALSEKGEPAVQITSGGIATAAASVLALKADASQVTIANTVAEGTLIDFLIAAGTLKSNGLLRMTCMGTMFNTSGANQGINLRTRFGSGSPVPLVTDTGGLNWISAGVTVPFEVDVLIAAKGATNSQLLTSRYRIGAGSSAGVTGLGAFNTGTANVNSESVNSFMAANTALDMTIDQHVSLSFQFNAALATLSITKMYALLETLTP